MNSTLRTDFNDGYGFSLGFLSNDRENTLVLFVRYLAKVDREEMNKDIESARRIVQEEAESRGWMWLRIREDIKVIELDRTKGQ